MTGPVELAEAATMLDAGDVGGAVRLLTGLAADAPPDALAPVLFRAAEAAGFEDLAAGCVAVLSAPTDPDALYGYGYACVARGLPALAASALYRALAAAPGNRRVLIELVVALERDGRYAEAVRLLDAHAAVLEPWPDRFLLARDLLLAGDVTRAAAEFAALGVPDDPVFTPVRAGLRAMLDRAAAVAGATPLDSTDLRGWHFALNGALLGTRSPYGPETMNGRYGYLQDSYPNCRRGLERLRAALAAAGRSPATVSVPPERSGAVLALAAARLLGLPAEPFAPGRPDTLVVVYDLTDLGGGTLAALRARPPGQLLAEHATCWTAPAPVAADWSTLLHEAVVPPWGSGCASAATATS